jgi:hypothetical protein
MAPATGKGVSSGGAWITTATANHLLIFIEREQFDHTESPDAPIQNSNDIQADMNIDHFESQRWTCCESDGPVIANRDFSAQNTVGVLLTLLIQRQRIDRLR